MNENKMFCDRCNKEINNPFIYISEIDHQYLCDNCFEKEQPKALAKQIDLLKQQLAEKDKEINSLIVDYEKRISQEQELMSNMEHLLTEKQNAIDEINKEFVQAVHDWKTLCAEKDKEIERLKNLFKLNNEVVINQGQEIFDLRVQVLQQKQNQTQLAIQELEKVKNFVDGRTYCANYIKKRIKELKGEKDEV